MNNYEQIKDQGEKQVVALESLKASDKKLPPIKDLISIKNLNPEIIKETEKIEEIKKKLTEIKWSIKELIKLMILEILKQYVLLVMKLEIMCY